MPVDLDLLCAHLEAEGLRYGVEREGEVIYVPFGGATVRVFLCEDGEGISVQVPQVFNLRDTPHREAALAWIAEHTYNTKIGHFGYDPRDGEVDVSHFCPVEDGTLTAEQFLRVIQVCRAVATEDVRNLRRVAFGRRPKAIDTEKDDADFDDEDEDDGFDEDPFADEDADVEEDEDEEDDDEEGAALEDVPELPPAPVDEGEWLELATLSFAALCADVDRRPLVRRLRDEVWPRLVKLRDASVAAGKSYRLPAVLGELGLAASDELVLLFMLARQARDDVRITTTEVEAMLGGEAAPLLKAQLASAVIVASDHDGVAPYRLGHRFLDPLTDLLPFDHEPLPAPLTVADLPPAPVSEARWLKMVHRALASLAVDIDLSERLLALRDTVWPRLLVLRRESRTNGLFAAGALADELHLSAVEELLVAYCAQRTVNGDRRVSLRALDRVARPDARPSEDDERILPVVEELVRRELLKAADEDDLPPYTLGPRAAGVYGV